MAKYIDAGKLIAEIGRRKEKCAAIAADERNDDIADYYHGKAIAYDEMSSLITSLQQVHPGLAGSEIERIRKELVAFFGEVRKRERNDDPHWHELRVADILSFLKNVQELPAEWSEEYQEEGEL